MMRITFEELKVLMDSILTKEEKNCKPPSVFFKEASDKWKTLLGCVIN
jgi:hypothetical protein